MSSKLKARPRKQRFPLAQSNQAAQAFGRAMVNCQSQIKSMEKEAYENGFNDGEDWADTINVVTTMMALRRLYGFSTKRLLTVMQTANEYVKMANSDSRKEYLVACTECDGMVERWRETEEEAVEQWNRRVGDKEDTKC